MISSLGVEESNEYRPAALCPEFLEKEHADFFAVTHQLESGTKEQNIEAVEKYTKALCDKLVKDLEKKLKEKQDVEIPEHPPPDDSTNSQLKSEIRKNLEKVANKSFSPSFSPNFTKAKTIKATTFSNLMDHTKGHTEKYAKLAKEQETSGVIKVAVSKNPDKNQDVSEYQDRVKARIATYKGWEFKTQAGDAESFILFNTKADQEIMVTKRENGAYSITSTSETDLTDETIGIMIELSHSVLRFSEDKNMSMTIRGLEQQGTDVTNKFEDGLKIINEGKDGPEKLKYTIEKNKPAEKK